MQKLRERLAASRFFTFSLLVHTVLIVLGGSIVLVHPPEPPDEIEGILPKGLADSSAVKPEVPEVLPPVTPATEPPLPPGGQVLSAITTAAPQPGFSLGPVSVAPSLGRSFAAMTEGPKVLTPKAGPGSASGAYLGRLSESGRGLGLGKNGGTRESEQAVLAGLRWLKANQSADGCWSPGEYTASMTGLALLCFLGHGELPVSPEFGPTVRRALDWALERGTRMQGRFAEIERSNSAVYEHAIMTYAVGEYVAMTHDERFYEVLRQAVGYIVQGQTALGGWDYQYNKGARNDLSVSGWQIQALKAAYLARIDIPGVEAALDRTVGYIKKMQGNEGGFGYTSAENRWSLTGVGVLCTYFWKGKKDETVREGIAYLLGKATDVKYASEKADLYAWYYHGQACLMYGDSAWKKWNGLFQPELCKSQSKDGSWPAMAANAHGNLQQKDSGAGPFYRTTLCVLMLEVFYRAMVTNQ